MSRWLRVLVFGSGRTRYFAHRRAFFPRVWPLMIVCAAVAVGVLQSYRLIGWPAVLFALLAGLVVASARFWVWRWMHPVRFPQEEALRRRMAR